MLRNRPPCRRVLVALLPLALLLLVGCADTRRYGVQVLNRTDAPLTIGLAKLGGPFEDHLASPEELAVGTPSSSEDLWPSIIVEPGRVGQTRVQGRFGGDAQLSLRVYAGARTLSEVLAVPRASGDRIDLVLRPDPGRNVFVVTRGAGRLRAEPVDELPAPSVAGPAR